MKHEQFLKILSIFIQKCQKRKGQSLIIPTFLNRFWFWQRSHVVQYGLLSSAKVTTDPIKHQESIVDETWAILKNYINFHTKMPIKKGSIVNNSYIFELILILTTESCCAVWSLVKRKSLEGSDKASSVYSRWNMSNS